MRFHKQGNPGNGSEGEEVLSGNRREIPIFPGVIRGLASGGHKARKGCSRTRNERKIAARRVCEQGHRMDD